MFSIFRSKKSDPVTTNDEGRGVRPMTTADIPAVITIIEAHDEDDAEEARRSFTDSLRDMFVAYDNEQIVGVTGSFPDPDADRIAWLSWTYVDERAREDGLGRFLLDGLLSLLNGYGVRKLFISTGDYHEDGADIYAAAKTLYEDIGARVELRQPDYYEPGETRYIYGLDLIDSPTVDRLKPNGDLVFEDLHPAPECDDGFIMTWREFQQDSDAEDPKKVLDQLISEARSQSGRFISAALPSDLAEGASKGLEEAGFIYVGELKNYYAAGIDQQHWCLALV